MSSPCYLLNLDVALDLLDERRAEHSASKQVVDALRKEGGKCYLPAVLLPLLEHLFLDSIHGTMPVEIALERLAELGKTLPVLPSSAPEKSGRGGGLTWQVMDATLQQMPEMRLLTNEEDVLSRSPRCVRTGDALAILTAAQSSGPVPFQDFSGQHQELAPELDRAVRRVMASRWYILGAEVEAFEEEFARYVGTRHCVGVGNGLDAMILVLRAWGIGPGDEVIVPAQTYIATWMAVSAVGAKLVPAEVDRDTCNLDPAAVEALITPATKAILPVHLFGHPADVAGLNVIARKHGLRVLEDCAQAHGGMQTGRMCGALGNAGAFSFYPGKNLGAFGDGGAVTTDDAELADKLRVLRNYGSRQKYVNDVIGTNSRLDPMQAALLRAKLPFLDEWNQRRAALAETYFEKLAHVKDLVLPSVKPGCSTAWHLFVVRHPHRDQLAEHLRQRGIGTLIHYPTPPWSSGAYAPQFPEGGHWPISESWPRTCLSLPLGPHNTVAELTRVSEAVAAFQPHE